jgi:hypothetical protein
MHQFTLASLAVVASISLVPFTTSAKADVVPAFSPSVQTLATSDLISTGNTVLAWDDSNQPGPVNGVGFSNSLTQNGVALSGIPGANGNGGNVTYLGAAFYFVLDEEAFDDQDASATLTLTGLTPGQQYDLQLFAGTNDDGFSGPNGSAYETVNGAQMNFGGNSPIDSFVTSTFSADSSGAADIGLAVTTPNVSGILSVVALNLQLVVPEPNSLALLCGVPLLFLCRRPTRVS